MQEFQSMRKSFLASMSYLPAKIFERWRRVSLRARLIVQLSTFLVISIFVFLYTSIQTIKTSTQVELQDHQVIAQLLANRVDSQLGQALQAMLSFLANNEPFFQDSSLESKKSLLHTLYTNSVLFKRVFLLDKTGRVLWMDPFDEQLAGVNITAPPYNRSVEGLNQPTYFPTISRQSGNPGVVLIVPLPKNTGTNRGFLLGWIDFGDPRAKSLLYPYEHGSRGYTDLVDEKGIILASTNPERVGQGSDHASYISELIENKQSAFGTCHSCHDSVQSQTRSNIYRTNEILAFAPLTHVPWGLAVRQPESEVFASTKVLGQRFIVLGLVILAAFFGLVWSTTRNIIRPMQLLSRACQQIASGDLSHTILDIGEAETASLAHSFEGMRRDLLKNKEEMLAIQRDLEKRVEERTAELTHYRDFLLKTNRDLTTLNKASAILVHNLDLDAALHTVLEQALDHFSGDAAGIFLLSEDECTFILIKQIGLLPEDVSTIKRMKLMERFPTNYYPTSPDSLAWHSAFLKVLNKDLKSRSILGVPLEERSEFFGELFIAANHPNHFSPEDSKLLSSIGVQISMSIRNARLYEAVQHKEREKSEMLHQIIVAQEEERKRVARELHDETSQGLTTLMLGLDTLDTAFSVDPSEAATIQEMNKAIVRQMLEDIRRITTDLRPSLLDDLGLIPAIAWYGDKRLSPLGITLNLDGQDFEEKRLSPDLEIILFRIIQEAITNVIRHAYASTVSVWIREENHSVAVQITDDGQGFDLQKVGSVDYQERGLGLRGMRERANLMGGELDVQSAPGSGTTIYVSVPMKKG